MNVKAVAAYALTAALVVTVAGCQGSGKSPTPRATLVATPTPSSTPSPTASPLATPTPSPALSATAVVVFSPFDADRLLPQFHVIAKVKGHCQSSDVLQRADALRCFLDTTVDGGNVADPCFSTPSAPVLVDCIPDPTATKAVQVTPDSPLPVDTTSTDPTSGTPWIIRLTDGTSCGFVSGATTTVAGLRDNYGCPHGDLYGDPDRKNALWTILYRATHSASLIRVTVASAYF